MTESKLPRGFQAVDSDVQKAATEALAGTGAELARMYPSGRAIGIVETRDAYELRIQVRDEWSRMISRQEISGLAGEEGGALLIAEVTAACKAGLADIAARCTAIVKAVSR